MGQEIWHNMTTLLADPAKMIAKGAPHVIHNDKELETYTTALFQLTALEKPSSAQAEAIELLTLLIERYEQEHYPIPAADAVSVVPADAEPTEPVEPPAPLLGLGVL